MIKRGCTGRMASTSMRRVATNVYLIAIFTPAYTYTSISISTSSSSTISISTCTPPISPSLCHVHLHIHVQFYLLLHLIQLLVHHYLQFPPPLSTLYQHFQCYFFLFKTLGVCVLGRDYVSKYCLWDILF